MKKPLIIAVDFDGTCVAHEYPKIGRDVGAVPVLRRLAGDGRILFMEFTAKDVACIPTGSDGKIRLHGATPVGEVDLDEILAHDAPVKMTEAR